MRESPKGKELESNIEKNVIQNKYVLTKNMYSDRGNII